MSDMKELYILQNQDNLFWGKQKEWLDGRDSNALFKTEFKDEAVNQVFEISSKDYTQRIKVLNCQVDEKGLPIVGSDILPAVQASVATTASVTTTELFVEEQLPEVDSIDAVHEERQSEQQE